MSFFSRLCCQHTGNSRFGAPVTLPLFRIGKENKNATLSRMGQFDFLTYKKVHNLCIQLDDLGAPPLRMKLSAQSIP